MDPEQKEKLVVLKRGIDQINKKLFVVYLILSMAFAAILTFVIDYYWDLRFVVYLVWFPSLTYVVYKLVFKISFTRIRRRFDASQNTPDELQNEIKDGFISIKFENYKFRINFKDCVYVLTDDFIFVFQAFRIFAILIIDSTIPKTDLDNILAKFKKQRSLKLYSVVGILIMITTIALKISLVTVNQNFFTDQYTYQIQKINIGDSTVFDNTCPEFAIITTNFLTDEGPKNDVVKFHCRNEYFNRIRFVYRSFENTTLNSQEKFGEKFMGTYTYQANNHQLTLFKDNIQIIIEKKPRKNQAHNN